MINKILSDDNIRTAIESLADKAEQYGLDGQKIKDLSEYWSVNKANIVEQIKLGSYQCGTIEEYQIINKKGKKRWISRLNSIDRLLLRAMHQILEPILNSYLSEKSFAFRKGIGIADAIEYAVEYIESGDHYIGSLDLKDYFDCISHDLLFAKLENVLDTDVVNLIKIYVNCNVLRENTIYTKSVGLVQGSPLSPVLANYYLNDTDSFLEQHSMHFIRFADDIKVFAANEYDCLQQIPDVSSYIENEKLVVNYNKTTVKHYSNVNILGYTFVCKESNKIIAEKVSQTSSYFKKWEKSAIEKTADTYHIIDDGILGIKDFSILFENEEKKLIIPPETTDTINVYSSIIFSSNFFSFLNRNRISLNIFDEYGEYVGVFEAKSNDKRSQASINQIQLYCNDLRKLNVAKEIEIAAAHNIRSNLKYYFKKYGQVYIEARINEINDLIKAFDNCKTVSDLLLIEAKIRTLYYSCFNHILDDDDFEFNKRTKRPPQTPLNSMISFGNSLLYQTIATEIRKSSLDIRIGFIHSPIRRQETLQYDLSEIFKPIIVDRVIFSLINKQVMNEELYFEKHENNGVYLNKTGKRIFINKYYEKLYDKITVDEKQITYKELIRRDIRNFILHINEGKAYKPYKYF